MKIPFNKQWIILEKEDYANYLFVTINWQNYSLKPKKWGFLPCRYLGAEYINSSCNLFIVKNGFDQVNRVHFQMLFSKPKLWDNLHKITKINSDKLLRLGNKIKNLKANQLSSQDLVKWIELFNDAQSEVHVPRGPMWCLETPDNLVSNYLQSYLSERAGDLKVKTKPIEAYQALIASLKKSTWTEEKEELAKIGLISNKKKREKKLSKHAKKFEWLEYGLQGRILDLNYFRKELNKMRRRGPAKFLKDLLEENKIIARKQKQISREYKIDSRNLKIFKLVQDSLYYRLYSKDAQFFGFYCLEPLFREVSRRTTLTLEQIRFLAPEDFKKVLILKKNFSKITKLRQKYSVHFSDRGRTVFYFGKQAKMIMKKIKFYRPQKPKTEKTLIQGQPAYSGKIRGRVKIINTVAEMVKIHAGNILVSHMTNPGIVPAMKQAAAIVTDMGGITCHAAIVARELKKPCIIGTKIATEALKDGDLVEVDADKGIVKKIK